MVGRCRRTQETMNSEVEQLQSAQEDLEGAIRNEEETVELLRARAGSAGGGQLIFEHSVSLDDLTGKVPPTSSPPLAYAPLPVRGPLLRFMASEVAVLWSGHGVHKQSKCARASVASASALLVDVLEYGKQLALRTHMGGISTSRRCVSLMHAVNYPVGCPLCESRGWHRACGHERVLPDAEAAGPGAVTLYSLMR